MREIKFRAWSTEVNDMFKKGDNYGTTHDTDCISYARSQDIILMQYTGLKDKNGVEIYEGDIVSFKVLKYSKKPSPNPKIIGREDDYAKILYKNGGFVMHRKYFWDEKYPIVYDSLADEQVAVWTHENCEVIGNIYENPELIKEQNDN